MTEVFKAKEAIEAGAEFGEYLANVAYAMDASVPDAVAQQHLQNARELAEGMILKGTLGASMLALMEAFPTVGAVVGTFAISYNGSRWVLEATGADKAVTVDLAVGAFDAANQAAEAAGNQIDRLWGGETRRERETRMLLETYQRALERGDIVLQDGMTMQDLVDAVNLGDIRRIHGTLIQSSRCKLPTAAAAPAPPPATKPVATGNPAPAAAAPPSATAPVFAYILEGIGVVVTTEAAVKTQFACMYVGGGPPLGGPCPNSGPPRVAQTLGGPYPSLSAAKADLKTKLDCFRGYWGDFITIGDKNYYLQNNVGVADCKSVKQL